MVPPVHCSLCVHEHAWGNKLIWHKDTNSVNRKGLYQETGSKISSMVRTVQLYACQEAQLYMHKEVLIGK